MIDRQPTKPGRIKLTADPNAEGYYYMERADEPTVEGSPINKATLFTDTNANRTGADLPSGGFDAILKDWGTINVPLSGWSSSATNGWFTNRVSISGMKSVFCPYVDLLYTSADTVDDEDYDFSCIKEIETYNGYIICKATEKPSRSLNLRLMGV